METMPPQNWKGREDAAHWTDGSFKDMVTKMGQGVIQTDDAGQKTITI